MKYYATDFFIIRIKEITWSVRTNTCRHVQCFVEREVIEVICLSKLPVHLRSSLTFDALMHFCAVWKFAMTLLHTLNIVQMIDKITLSSIGNQYMVMLCFIVRIRSEGVSIDCSVETCRIIMIFMCIEVLDGFNNK